MAALLGPHDKYDKLIESGKKVSKNGRATETKVLKQRLIGAFYQLGGLKGLVKWARKNDDNRKFVYGAIFRLIPVERQVTEESHSVVVQLVSAVPRPKGQIIDVVGEPVALLPAPGDNGKGYKVKGKTYRKRRTTN